MTIFLLAVVIALWVVFAASSVSKVGSKQSRGAFEESLRLLRLLPGQLVRPLAGTVVSAEIAIALGLGWGVLGLVADAAGTRPVIVATLFLTIGLLIVLTCGIAVALVRGTPASCACFGASDRPLSRLHVIRNGALLLIAITGAALASATSPGGPEPIGVLPAGVVGAVAGLVLIRLDDLIDLFTPLSKTSRARS
jgi:hypothetical protein